MQVFVSGPSFAPGFGVSAGIACAIGNGQVLSYGVGLQGFRLSYFDDDDEDVSQLGAFFLPNLVNNTVWLTVATTLCDDDQDVQQATSAGGDIQAGLVAIVGHPSELTGNGDPTVGNWYNLQNSTPLPPPGYPQLIGPTQVTGGFAMAGFSATANGGEEMEEFSLNVQTPTFSVTSHQQWCMGSAVTASATNLTVLSHVLGFYAGNIPASQVSVQNIHFQGANEQYWGVGGAVDATFPFTPTYAVPMISAVNMYMTDSSGSETSDTIETIGFLNCSGPSLASSMEWYYWIYMVNSTSSGGVNQSGGCSGQIMALASV